jgi:hypothetical protein
MQWVAEDIEHNGTPMQIQSFRGGGSADQVMQFYRDRWSSRADGDVPGFVENKVGPWQVISIIENGSVLALQLQNGPNGQASGFASVTNPAAISATRDVVTTLPRPSGSTLISHTRSRDGMRQASTLVLTNNRALSSNRDFYANAMPGKGWAVSHQHEHQGTAVLLFERDGQSCEIAISRNDRGKTVIVANLTREAT